MRELVRVYRYRLSPTKAQARQFMCWLVLTRELYNAALGGDQGCTRSSLTWKGELNEVR